MANIELIMNDEDQRHFKRMRTSYGLIESKERTNKKILMRLVDEAKTLDDLRFVLQYIIQEKF